MTRRASNVVPIPDAAIQTAPQEPTFTWNFRTPEESITVRTSDYEDLMELRNKFRETFSPHEAVSIKAGDVCPNCSGALQLKEGQKNGKAYRFLGCSGYPTCRFTAKA